jgi:hypothetical protein
METRVFKKRVLKRMFGCEKDEVVVGGRRKLRNEELCNLCCSLHFFRVI